MKNNFGGYLALIFCGLFFLIVSFYIGYKVGRYHERKALVEKATKAAGDLLNRVK